MRVTNEGARPKVAYLAKYTPKGGKRRRDVLAVQVKEPRKKQWGILRLIQLS